MKAFRHYIITRFNLGIYDKDPFVMYGKIKMDPDNWMRHRMELFSRYTLPSIMGQTCQNFTWVICVDKATPDSWKHVLESIDYPNLRLLYLNIRQDKFIGPINTVIGKIDSDCITTRIDNDDAFHVEAIQRLQQCYFENADKPYPWAMIFSYGCVYDIFSKELSLCRHLTNNCCTLVESPQSIRTVMGYNHSKLSRKCPTIHIEDKPYWLMVCHDQNVLNSMWRTERLDKLQQQPVPVEFLAFFNAASNACPSGPV